VAGKRLAAIFTKLKKWHPRWPRKQRVAVALKEEKQNNPRQSMIVRRKY
jgi:hypothetical protein